MRRNVSLRQKSMLRLQTSSLRPWSVSRQQVAALSVSFTSKIVFALASGVPRRHSLASRGYPALVSVPSPKLVPT